MSSQQLAYLGPHLMSEKMGYYFAPTVKQTGENAESLSWRIGPFPKVHQRAGPTLRFKYGLWHFAQPFPNFFRRYERSKIRPRSSASVLLEFPA